MAKDHENKNFYKEFDSVIKLAFITINNIIIFF